MAQPSGKERRFLTAEWRHLALLNFPVEREVLEPFVPKGTMVDTYKGVAYLSVVGFLFLKTRICGVPVPGHGNFEEVNLRFYVRRLAGDEWRRGVVFVKEIVPKPAIAVVARTVYNERYIPLPMRHSIATAEDGHTTSVEYAWQHKGHWNHVRASRNAGETEPAPGSLEEFITEHYWGYVRQRDGSTVEYRVDHPRWIVAAATAELQCDIARVYGDVFVPALQQSPRSAFVANGSEVSVFRGRAIL